MIFQSSSVRNISSTSQEHKLTFRPPEEGFVNCAATNELGTNDTTALIVFVDNNHGEAFYIQESSTLYPVTVGDELSITCIVINPNFEISLEWYLNDTLVDWILSGMEGGFLLK